MFEKILYPTDFSDVSKKALDYIKQLKEGGAKEVVVLHVIDEREIESIHRASAYVSYEKEVDKIIEENAKEQTRLIEAELNESGFDVKTRIEKGIPFTDILRVEEEEAVSVIVIGLMERATSKKCSWVPFRKRLYENAKGRFSL